MKNFLIAYRAREGSSAIVNMLSKQPRVQVPLFEQLDRPSYAELFKPQEIGRVLDYVYSTGRYQPDAIRQHIRDGTTPDAGAEGTIVGFKWRMFDGAIIADTLRKHDVLVAFLCRRNFIELTSSLYITDSPESNLPGRRPHPQFALARMHDAERETFLSGLDELKIDADAGAFLAIARHALEGREKLAQHLSELQAAGIDVRVVHYEDFVASNSEFIMRFLAALGSPRDDVIVKTRYQKVMRRPAAEKLTNLQEIIGQPQYHGLRERYEKVIAQFAPLAPAA